MVSRGDVWLVQFENAGNDAVDGAYPCLIVSPPEIHDHLGMVIVAPVTEASRPAAFRVPGSIGDQAAVIRLEQIRTVETRRLTRQIGTLDRKTLATALATLREMFAE